MQKRLIIAAGHGQGDVGAVGQGTTEAATCIDIVNRVADLIRADGRLEVHVVPHELGLDATIEYINRRFRGLDDGYCLEVHKNAAVGGHGVEVWYYGGDNQSQAYARSILDGLVAVTGLPNRGTKGDDTNRWGRLGFIRDTNPWAGLAECGFITDGGDPLFPDKYAMGIYQGALKLFGFEYQPQVAVPTPQPVKPGFRWRVTNLDGKQLGVYNEQANAWNKYLSVSGSARIYEAAGRDVTGEFVAKYRPAAPAPAQEPAQDAPKAPETTPTPQVPAEPATPAGPTTPPVADDPASSEPGKTDPPPATPLSPYYKALTAVVGFLTVLTTVLQDGRMDVEAGELSTLIAAATTAVMVYLVPNVTSKDKQ